MADFELVFKTRAELQAAQETLANVARINEAATKMGPAMARSGEQGAEAFHLVHHHVRAITNELYLMGVHVPEIGHLLHLAFSPQMLGIAAASLAVTELAKGIRETHEEIEKFNSIHLEMGGLKGTLFNYRDTMREIRKANEEFSSSIDSIIHHQKSLSEVFQEATNAINRQIEARNKLATATEEADTSEIEFLKARGLLSEQEYNKLKLKVQLENESKKLHQQDADEQAKIKAMKDESAKEGGAADKAAKDVKNAEGMVIARKADQQQLEDNIKHRQEQINKMGETIASKEDLGKKMFGGWMQGGRSIWDFSIDELVKERQRGDIFMGPHGEPIGGAGISAVLRAKQSIDVLRQQEKGYVGQQDQDKEALAQAKDAVIQQNIELDKLKEKAKAAATALAELNKKLDEATKQYDEDVKNRKAEFGQFAAKSAFGSLASPTALPAPPAYDRKGFYHLDQFGRKVYDSMDSFDNLIALAQLMAGVMADHKWDIADLRRQIETLSGRAYNSPGVGGGTH